jgi:D-alanyl-lipoteichoic acid acyltransferase DltB (MBOAT superfamily)
MLFNSIHFALFFPVIFLLHWAVVGRSKNGQNLLILAASYYFYGCWSKKFLLLLIFTTTFDYFIGKAIYNSSSDKRRKWLLAASVTTSVCILGFFKYFNFFVDSFTALLTQAGLHVNPITLNIILPVGISFYTFQSISYSIEIYRRRIEPVKDILAFYTYVAFFPQLVAGPIERPFHLLPQFLVPRTFKNKQARDGARLILWGLFKKIALADTLAIMVDKVYAEPDLFSGGAILFATFLFAFQIYCDFSGYTDIARGTARLLGVELMMNFRTPYFSKSIKEFWTRWHISLSTWFRDYVYISLGGSRKGTLRWIIAISATFLLSGLWHGANITFIIWGAIHGLAYLTEAALAGNRTVKNTLIKLLQGLLTFSIVCVAWVFFRASTASQAFHLITRMGDLFSAGYGPLELYLANIHGIIAGLVFLALFLVFLVVEALSGLQDINAPLLRWPAWLRWGFYYVLIAGIILFGNFVKAQTFIYFQF